LPKEKKDGGQISKSKSNINWGECQDPNKTKTVPEGLTLSVKERARGRGYTGDKKKRAVADMARDGGQKTHNRVRGVGTSR